VSVFFLLRETRRAPHTQYQLLSTVHIRLWQSRCPQTAKKRNVSRARAAHNDTWLTRAIYSNAETSSDHEAHLFDARGLQGVDCALLWKEFSACLSAAGLIMQRMSKHTFEETRLQPGAGLCFILAQRLVEKAYYVHQSVTFSSPAYACHAVLSTDWAIHKIATFISTNRYVGGKAFCL
jgi:hypothetical protein